MGQLSVRLDDKIEQRMMRLQAVYGGTRTSLVENALECWLDRFEAAPEGERLAMIVRPKVRPGAEVVP